jgi:signal transduction histidine kinase
MATMSPRDQGSRPVDQLALLYALAAQVQRARHADVVYEQTVEDLRRAVGADGSALLILQDGLVRISASSGLSESCLAGLEGFAPWRPDARDPQPVAVSDTTSDPRVDAVRGTLLSEGIVALACVPLLHRLRPIGEILLLRRAPVPFTEEDVRFTEAVAGHLAFAIWRGRSDADQAELLRRFDAERSVLESVVKQMPAGVLLADVPSGRIVMSNAQVQVLWGRTLKRTSQISDYALWSGYDSTGRQLDPADWPLARSVLHGESVRGEEIGIDRADGSRIIVRMSSAPVLDSRGRRLAAVATVDDVTGERDKEARRAFIEGATRALTASLETTATLAELARLVVGPYADWCVIFRCQEGGQIDRVEAAHAKHRASDLLEPFRRGTIQLDSNHPVARAIRSGQPSLVTDARECRAMLLDDGDSGTLPAPLVPTCVLTLPLMARDRGLGALSVVRTRGRYTDNDMDLLVELAERAGLALDNSLLYEQARAADRQKASFLAVMSHEFRTPLSAILGYADILMAEVHGTLSPRQRTDVDRVKASVRHLSHLVDEILSYASMEAGRERIRLAPVDAVAVARDVAGIMEPIAEAAGLELRLGLLDAPLEMVTDPSKLRQILINLVSNGVKYTTDGYVELALEVEQPLVRFRVRDTGAGIAEAHLEDVFEPFWRVDGNDGRVVKGTGLGLAVARRLSRLMGGDIRLQSAMGAGSEFMLELPLAGPDGVAANPAP